MKHLIALSIVFSLLAGCASPNQSAYRTLGSIGVAATSAMEGWAAWANAGKADADEIKTVEAAYRDYQRAYKLATSAAAIAAQTGDANASAKSIQILVAAQSKLIEAITAALPDKEAADLIKALAAISN